VFLIIFGMDNNSSFYFLFDLFPIAHLSFRHHAGKRTLCDMCGGALDATVPNTLPVGFPCQICGDNLHSTLRLIAHSFKHTGIKPFFCPLCPRNFTRRERLHAHVEAFHQAQNVATLGVRRRSDDSATDVRGERDEADEDDDDETEPDDLSGQD
jgi:hypothetical protein